MRVDPDFPCDQHLGRGMHGPLRDRDVGPGSGDHRGCRYGQDRYELVADPAALAWIDHYPELFKQVTAAALDPTAVGVRGLGRVLRARVVGGC